MLASPFISMFYSVLTDTAKRAVMTPVIFGLTLVRASSTHRANSDYADAVY